MSNIPGINTVTTELRTRSTPSQANNENVAPKASQAVEVTKNSPDKSVRLSETAQVINEVQKELDSYPVVDESRVAELKSKIASGDYYPDGAKIAGKLIMLEKLIKEEPSGS